jgi:hypothetical protein
MTLKQSLTLREARRIRVCKNRILRRIFLPKRDDNGEWKRLHSEEPHNLNKQTSRKKTVGRPRPRWEENIRMYLKEIGSNMRNSVNSGQDRNYLRHVECDIEAPGFISHGFS